MMFAEMSWPEAFVEITGIISTVILVVAFGYLLTRD